MYFSGAVAYSRSRHGRGTGPVHLDEVQCIQTHQSLVDCYRNSFGEVRADCADHSKDASVFCPSEFMPQCHFAEMY